MSKSGVADKKEIEVTSSGIKERKNRDEIIQAAQRLVVWKLDRWERSLVDLINGLHDFNALGVSFVSMTGALDFTTPSGKAMAGMLSVFVEFERDMLREQVKVGIELAWSKGKPHGRQKTAALKKSKLKISIIARKLEICRTSVRRLLNLKALSSSKHNILL